mmetsp:Transcript_14388/g.40101  ORF Transcript_14388/g.40101 Transcript_14388/m.40101 type:complete len:199 (-) Transcript_14388:2-598(-)
MSSMNGEYTGYFVITNCRSTPRDETCYHSNVVFESDVQLTFTLCRDYHENEEDRILLVSGLGTNTLGAFVIIGKATSCVLGEKHVYQMSVENRYRTQSHVIRGKQSEGSPSNTITTNKCIYSGCPIQALDGGWLVGWIEKVFQRHHGTGECRYDRYWCSPGKRLRFRSIKSVQCFLLRMNVKGQAKGLMQHTRISSAS